MGCAPSSEKFSMYPDTVGTRNNVKQDQNNTSASKEHGGTKTNPEIKKETPKATIPMQNGFVPHQNKANLNNDVKKERGASPVNTEIDSPEVNTEKEAKVMSLMGRHCHQILDTRSRVNETVDPPNVERGHLWIDSSFPCEVAMGDTLDIEWKRPKEFREKPVLFADGTTRFDIGQGGAGTCWFLSVLAALADRDELIKQLIFDDYNIGTEGYKGIFHCRFWKLGEWKDIYVDDYLPIRPDINMPWGSHSKTDANEIWVSLMEKAFAKFKGSYANIEGGNTADAFMALTGGIADLITHGNVNANTLYTRIKNALNSDCILTGSVPVDKDGLKGLSGGHAYSIVNTTSFFADGKRIKLLRVRNPWGTGVGEWKGAWSDSSIEWAGVSDSLKEQLQASGKDDGEFWIDINNYLQYFQDTTICTFTPDFDQNGAQDNLENTSIIFGEWLYSTHGKQDFQQIYHHNPRFTFSMPWNSVERDSTMPVVIQLTQERLEDGHLEDLTAIRIDLYKVEASFRHPKLSVVLDESEVSRTSSFVVSENICFRFRLSPGKYLIIPRVFELSTQKEFMIRLFAPHPLDIKKHDNPQSVFLRRFEIEEALQTSRSSEYEMEHHCGQWVSENAGGQICNETFEINPQYALTIQDRRIEILVSLKQDALLDCAPLGMKLYKVDHESPPLNMDYILTQHDAQTITPTMGHSFLISCETAAVFHLDPGVYVLIVYLDTAGVEKDYVLSVAYRKTANLRIEGYNLFNDSTS